MMPLPVEFPISKFFPSDRQREIEEYCLERLDTLKQSLFTIRERKITQWRRIYTGMPKEAVKSFPWQNASNLVVQLVGSFVDQLKAKILMSVFGVDPLFEVEVVGEWDRNEHAEEQKQALQDWLTYTGVETNYLNLMPKYSAWVSSIIRYGRGTIKLIPEMKVEQVAASESSTGKILFEERVRHNGPVAHPIIFEDFLIPLTTAEIVRSPFTAQRARMSKFDLQLMRHDKTYNQVAVEELLTKGPDRDGPENTDRELQGDQGARGVATGPTQGEWDIYECYFPYTVLGKVFHLIFTVSLSQRKILKSVFNWLPENSSPFILGILGYDGERSSGLGFCEMLKDYQEEVSAIHNRRGDAATLANVNIFRVGGGNQLDSQFSVYPNAIFSGEDGAIEAIPLGRQANETIKDEQMTLNLATDRAGIGPSSSGAGAGTVNKKGAYSSMGTYAVQQEGDTRANLNKTEFRMAHVQLGRQKTLYDSHFEVSDEDIRKFGKQGPLLKKALANVKSGRLALPIRAVTGSINKEVEKQNFMLLWNNVRAHWQMVSQMLQAAENPMLSPMQRDYLLQTIVAGNILAAKVSKDFGISDPSAVLPSPAGIEAAIRMAHDMAEQQQAQQIAQQIRPQLTNGQLPQAGPPQQPGPPNSGVI